MPNRRTAVSDNDQWVWSDYFSEDELRCKETGELDMDEDFMNALWVLRDVYGKPIIVTSGYRSPEHSAEVDKDKPGEHTLGLAADIYVPPEDVFYVIAMAYFAGFTRLGVHQKGEGRFIHLGMATEEDGFPEVVWTY